MYCPNDDVSISPPQKLTLRIFKIEEEDEFKGSLTLNIIIKCFDINSDKYICRINNFPVHCCLELPEYSFDQYIPDGNIKNAQYIPRNEKIYWDDRLANELFNKFCYKLKSKNGSIPIGFSFKMLSGIYDYNKGQKKPYMYIYFESLKARQNFRTLCCRFHMFLNKDYQYIAFTIHENKVSTSLRLLTKQNINYDGWFSCEGREIPFNSINRICNENYKEFFIDYNSMKPINEKESMGWKIYPTVVGFDFEVYGHKGTKRMPSAMETKDAIYMISIDCKKIEHPKSRRKYCLVYGKTDPIEGCEMIYFSKEEDMLIAFAHMFKYLDPDFITGYNIYNFDWPYYITRCELHHISSNLIPNMGVYNEHQTEIYSQNWQSSGAGNNDITYVIAKGRMCLDLLPSLKRLKKLRMHSLNYVSEHYLKRKKLDASVAEMFDAYEAFHIRNDKDKIDKMTKIAEYCIRDSELCVDLIEVTKLWYHFSSLSGVSGISIEDIYLRGEQCRCYSRLYNKCYNYGYVISNGRTYDYYYTGGFVGKPIPGVYLYVGTIDFTSLYPSIMQAYNLCFRTFIPISMWEEIPEEYCEVIPFYQHEPTEHFSMSRKMDIEQKLKLKSKGFNCTVTDEEIEYCNRKTIIVPPKNLDENETEKIEFDPIDLTDHPNLTNRYYEFRFIKKEYLEGFMPMLEREWVAARKEVKNTIKKLNSEKNKLNSELELIESNEEDKIKQINEEINQIESQLIINDKKQNSIKIIANSGYGFCGAKNGMLPGLPVAMSVTALGRKLTQTVNTIVEKDFSFLNAKVVYNDTDSSMVSLDIDQSYDLIELGEALEESINGRSKEKTLQCGVTLPIKEAAFKSPLKVEFENFSQMCPIKPKFYHKAIRELNKDKIAKTGEFELNADGTPYIMKKGVLTAKKGNSVFSEILYDELSKQVLFKKPIISAINFLLEHVMLLLMDKYEARKLTKVTGIGSNYKEENGEYYMSVFSKNLTKWGNPVKPGDRIEYIIVKTWDEIKKGKSVNIGHKCREINMWENDPNREPLDYEYYVEKGIKTQYDGLFYIGYSKILDCEKFKKIGYKPKFSQCDFVHFKEPIRMISAIVADYTKVSDEKFSKYLIDTFNIEYDTIYPRNYYIASLIEFELKSICNYIEINGLQ